MLGKGLESLIPSSGGQKPGDDGVNRPKQDDGVLNDSINQVGQNLSTENLSGQGSLVSTGKVHHSLNKENPGGQAVFQIEVDKIKPNPHQPRKDFDQEAIKDLASSIREVGILQPLVVTKVEKETPTGTDVEYILIAGERRLLASKLLGLERVPAIVKRVDFERERLEMAIVENLQREDLNPIETARAFSRLQDEFNLTQREIATRLGKSREAIANAVRLLDLPAYIQDSLAKGEITETHGRLLLSVSDPATQKKLFDDIVFKKMTTRELKERVVSPNKKESTNLSSEMAMLQQELTSKLGAPVRIEKHGDTGKITIRYYSDEELRSILDKLKLE